MRRVTAYGLEVKGAGTCSDVVVMAVADEKPMLISDDWSVK